MNEETKAAPKPKEKKVQGVKESARIRTLAETTGEPAVVSLGVLPWGEIYLDGRMQGVSPPLLELQVVEGKHEIKISNTTFPAVTRTITVKSGEKIKIKHRFAN
jgi:serine/threonine-protein kinase